MLHAKNYQNWKMLRIAIQHIKVARFYGPWCIYSKAQSLWKMKTK